MVVLARAVAARFEARDHGAAIVRRAPPSLLRRASGIEARLVRRPAVALVAIVLRSEEHTSELQSRVDLVCRLLLEKKKNRTPPTVYLVRSRDRSGCPRPRSGVDLGLL